MKTKQAIEWLKNVWTNITVEPVGLLFAIVTSLSGIAGSELYLKKGCKVNLNYTMDILSLIHI